MGIKSILFTIMAGTALMASAKPLTVSSPDKSISLKFDADKGIAQYSVERNGKAILNPSRLGIDIKDGIDFSEGFSVAQASQDSHSETWRPVWGEEAEIADNYNELRVTLAQKKLAPGRTLDIVFRVFNDGIGFRYEFPRQKDLGDFTIMNELTEFAFADNHTTWSIPAEGYRFYEALFREMPLDSMGYVSTPVTIRASDGTHMALHQANLTDYAAMNVEATPGSNTLRARLTPWMNGDAVYVTNVRVSPWRTLIIADNAGDMALSRIMLNLNEPCAVENAEEFCKPQRYTSPKDI